MPSLWGIWEIKKTSREAYTFLEDFSGGPVLFDPIMADHGKFYSNFDESYNELLKGLIPRCTLMTPNYTESCLLTGEAYEESCGKEKFLRITEKLKNLNCKNAVLTSIPLEDGLSAVGILDGDEAESGSPMSPPAGLIPEQEIFSQRYSWERF